MKLRVISPVINMPGEEGFMRKKFFAVLGLICFMGLVTLEAAKIGTRAMGEDKAVSAPAGPVVTKDGVKFVYKGSAQAVSVAGSFNDWNATKDALKEDSPGVWTVVLPLSPKQYQYKFVVDGNWAVDALNPKTADDGYGGKNSMIEVTQVVENKKPAASSGPAVVKEGTKFVYKGKANTVLISGSFNDWNGMRSSLTEASPDVWEIVLPLAAGQYQYKFVVDGNWVIDALNPATADDGYGGKNSAITVKKSAAAQKAKGAPAVKEGTKFSVKAPNASKVCIAGSFNNWSADSDPMSKDNSGIWTITKKLKSGKYQYKFVIDGNWSLDSGNLNTSDDGYGGKNSIIEVK